MWEEPLRDLSKPRALLGHNSQEAVSLCHPQQRLSREFSLRLPHSSVRRPVQVCNLGSESLELMALGQWMSERVANQVRSEVWAPFLGSNAGIFKTNHIGQREGSAPGSSHGHSWA